MLYDPTIGDATDRLLVLAIFMILTCFLSIKSLAWVWGQLRRPRAAGGYAGKDHVVRQCLAVPKRAANSLHAMAHVPSYCRALVDASRAAGGRQGGAAEPT